MDNETESKVLNSKTATFRWVTLSFGRVLEYKIQRKFLPDIWVKVEIKSLIVSSTVWVIERPDNQNRVTEIIRQIKLVGFKEFTRLQNQPSIPPTEYIE